LGLCQVIRVSLPRLAQVSCGDLGGPIEAPRVLLATGSYPDTQQFTEDFAALSPELIDELSRNDVRLVGIDTPSVDLFEDRSLPVHHRCLKHGIAILEGLVMTDVPAGLYELIALPLKLAGFDASPVRAILRSQ
jgi:arylformamidase